MNPKIEFITEKKIVGLCMFMNLANNMTHTLWKAFMPLRKNIHEALNEDMISMQVYGETYFQDFNPNCDFEKWAAVEVANFDDVSTEMKTFVIPGGLYAIFDYRGLSTDHSIFEYIFNSWLPNSGYVPDNRPHFEILGERYKNNDPTSEEQIYIPIKIK